MRPERLTEGLYAKWHYSLSSGVKMQPGAADTTNRYWLALLSFYSLASAPIALSCHPLSLLIADDRYGSKLVFFPSAISGRCSAGQTNKSQVLRSNRIVCLQLRRLISPCCVCALQQIGLSPDDETIPASAAKHAWAPLHIGLIYCVSGLLPAVPASTLLDFSCGSNFDRVSHKWLHSFNQPCATRSSSPLRWRTNRLSQSVCVCLLFDCFALSPYHHLPSLSLSLSLFTAHKFFGKGTHTDRQTDSVVQHQVRGGCSLPKCD